LIPPSLVSKYSISKLIGEPQTSGPSYFMVPYQENRLFVGREELLSQLFEMLHDSQEYQHNHRVALYGLGGVGKTQTALKYVYSKKKYYRSIFWISAVNQATLRTEFQKIMTLTQPNIPVPDSPDQIANLVHAWLQQQSSWLLIFDNLDDINVIEGFLPVNNNRRHTLITTRNPNAEYIPAQGLEVNLMSGSEATKFFLIRAGFPLDSESYINEAGRIVKELGYLPLAIEQAAAYTRESKRKIEEYLPLYQASRSSRQHLYNWVPHGPRAYQYSVATTWNISITQIVADPSGFGVIASYLLYLFAFLNPDGILIEFLQRGSPGIDDDELRDLLEDEVRLDGALQLLQRFSLIKLISKPRSITIHRMVQEVIQHNMNDDTLSLWWDLIAGLFLSAFPELSEDYKNLPECRKYQDQILPSLLSLPPNIKSPALDSALHRLGWFLRNDGKYVEAREIGESKVRVSQALSGANAPDTLTGMHNLALTYWHLGRYDDAMSLGKRVLNASKEILGERHLDTLTAMGNLAATYRGLGRYDDAMSLEKRVLDASKEILGEKHPDTLTAMGNLAATYRGLGRYDDAMSLGKRVLDASKEILGEKHLDTLRAMGNLAGTYRGLGRHDDAMSLEERVLDASKEILGEKHPDTLTAMGNLASTYRELGRYDDAMSLGKRVLDASKEVLGEKHHDTLRATGNLANTLMHIGMVEEAISLATKCVEGLETVLGKEHPSTLVYRNNLEEMRREALELRENSMSVEEMEIDEE